MTRSRVDAEVRRSLILDAAERLFAEGDPLLVTFDEVASAAGVSRALVYKHVPDRRGLHDAVQVRLITRLDRWVAHGLDRADTPRGARRALVHGIWSFVSTDPDGWRVLAATGGRDHPIFHALVDRWARAAHEGGAEAAVAVRAAVAGVVAVAGELVARADDGSRLVALLDGAAAERGGDSRP